MKTIGEIISSTRTAQNLTLDEISKATKIDVKYIEALENNRFDLLPPPTFTKGFIRNVARVLGKSPDDLIAIYRRDLPASNKVSVDANQSTNQPMNKFTLPPRSTIIMVALGLFAFFGYLAFQYRALLIPPPLSVEQPTSKAVVNSPVSISGRTSVDSLVTVSPDQAGGETDVKPDSTGAFSSLLNLSPGQHQLTITATNRFGRSASKSLEISVLSTN